MTGRAALPKTDDDGEVSPSELVRILQRQVEALTAAVSRSSETVERQAKIIDMMLAAKDTAPAPEPPPPPIAVPARSDLTFAQLWERYTESMASKHWLPSMKSLMKKVVYHFAPSLCVRGSLRGRRNNPRILFGPDLLAADLRPYHWSDFRDRLKLLEPTSAVQTRNLMLKRLKAMYNWALDEGRLDKNPIARVKVEPTRPKRETEISDKDIALCKSLLIRAYLLTLVDSGMRPGEVRRLRRDQFDLDGRTVLSWTKTKGKKTRPAWVTPRVLDAYEALPRYPGNPYIFASPRSALPYSASRLWQMFQVERRAVGMQAAPGDGTVHAHDGRRAFASRLNRKNVSINKIQLLLGHADIGTTQSYLSLDEADLVDAHRQLDAAKRRAPVSKKPADDDE